MRSVAKPALRFGFYISIFYLFLKPISIFYLLTNILLVKILIIFKIKYNRHHRPSKLPENAKPRSHHSHVFSKPHSIFPLQNPKPQFKHSIPFCFCLLDCKKSKLFLDFLGGPKIPKCVHISIHTLLRTPSLQSLPFPIYELSFSPAKFRFFFFCYLYPWSHRRED